MQKNTKNKIKHSNTYIKIYKTKTKIVMDLKSMSSFATHKLKSTLKNRPCISKRRRRQPRLFSSSSYVFLGFIIFITYNNYIQHLRHFRRSRHFSKHTKRIVNLTTKQCSNKNKDKIINNILTMRKRIIEMC